jgi:hypothetical protein
MAIVLKVYLLQRTLVGLVGREGGSREVRQRRKPRRGRPGAGIGKAAKREDELGREGSR